MCLINRWRWKWQEFALYLPVVALSILAACLTGCLIITELRPKHAAWTNWLIWTFLRFEKWNNMLAIADNSCLPFFCRQKIEIKTTFNWCIDLIILKQFRTNIVSKLTDRVQSLSIFSKDSLLSKMSTWTVRPGCQGSCKEPHLVLRMGETLEF